MPDQPQSEWQEWDAWYRVKGMTADGTMKRCKWMEPMMRRRGQDGRWQYRFPTQDELAVDYARHIW